jgi:hypothetical protein
MPSSGSHAGAIAWSKKQTKGGNLEGVVPHGRQELPTLAPATVALKGYRPDGVR